MREENVEYENGVESDDDYVSPSIARLERRERRGSPVRRIANGDAPSVVPKYASTDQLAALQERLATLEQRQVDLAANLVDAHAAFTQMGLRVANLEQSLLRQERRPRRGFWQRLRRAILG